MCKRVKMAAVASLCLAIWWSVATTVYADKAIKSVAVTVTSSVVASGDGGSVSTTADSTKYHVIPCDFINRKSQWKAGDIPKVSIELTIERGYYFNNVNTSGAHIWGVDYVASEKSDVKQSLAMTVKLKGVKGTLNRVEDAYWEEKPLGKTKWARMEGTSSYEVKLFYGGSMVYHVPRTSSVSYDFLPYMTEAGDYYLKVRAVVRSESESDYLKMGDRAESGNQEVTGRGARAADKRPVSTGVKGVNEKGGTGPQSQTPGWVQGQNDQWYRNEDRTYPMGKQNMIGDKWYLSDMNGYMLTGWQWKNDRECYPASNGDMVTGWSQYNRIQYYLDPEQEKLTGTWLQQGDGWCYLSPDGSMATGWLLSQGS